LQNKKKRSQIALKMFGFASAFMFGTTSTSYFRLVPMVRPKSTPRAHHALIVAPVTGRWCLVPSLATRR
jgi:hypothetical protein